jgi:hypothetical protein
MRPLWIPVAIACGVLAVAGVASAAVREEARSLAATMTAMTPVPDDASPSPEPSPSGTESPTPSPTPSETTAPEEIGDESTAEGNHGAAVSEVARDKEAVGTKTLPNGKTIENHGMAVSAAAHAKADTSTEADTETGGEGHAKGHSGGNDKGKSGR